MPEIGCTIQMQKSGLQVALAVVEFLNIIISS